MSLYRRVKRTMDLILAVIALVFAGPVMLIVALAVRLDGDGPVLFRQQRLGKDGKSFTLYKYRKFPDVDSDLGPGVTMANDIRMTGLGEFLERFKLDELPQLWNVLKGDMSFVGPRPESVRYRDLFVGEYEKVLDYVPGIFGPNQIAFRNESQLYPPERDPEEFYKDVLFPQKVKTDLEYCARATLWRDLYWIVRGIWTTIYGGINWTRVVGLHGRIVAMDILVVLAAWILANLIRFGDVPDDWNQDVFIAGCWLMPMVVGLLMMIGGCYRHPVRLFALVDAVRLVVVVSLAWILGYLIIVGFLYRHASVSLAPLGLLLVIPMMLAPRVWWRERWLKTHAQSERKDCKQLLIYGAGRKGTALASLLQQGFPGANIVGFLDDDNAAMGGRVIQGYKVLGSERDLNTVLALKKPDQIWVTFIPDEHKYRRLSEWTERNKVELVILPTTLPFSSLLFGDVGHGTEETSYEVPASQVPGGERASETVER